MQDQFNYPLLVVAGFPRTGTTSIYRNLEMHPGFAVPIRKELDFFRQAERPLNVYKAHFPRHPGARICVDVSPLYSLDLAVPDRLSAAVPQARVVLLVREPAGWIQSLYAQVSSYTPDPPTLSQFVADPVVKLFNRQVDISLSEGVYRRSLEAFGTVFQERLLIIDFAAFELNPLEILRTIEEFAGASPYFTAENVDLRPHNSSRRAQRYPPQLVRLLSQEGVVRVASKVVPAPLLRRARSLLYYAGDEEKPVADAASNREHDAAIARDATAADRETYAELFRSSPVRRASELC